MTVAPTPQGCCEDGWCMHVRAWTSTWGYELTPTRTMGTGKSDFNAHGRDTHTAGRDENRCRRFRTHPLDPRTSKHELFYNLEIPLLEERGVR